MRGRQSQPVTEEQYQERFWRRRPDGIGLDTAIKEFLAIEFKRTQDARSNYVERATEVRPCGVCVYYCSTYRKKEGEEKGSARGSVH
jgi:hypothetical protein